MSGPVDTDAERAQSKDRPSRTLSRMLLWSSVDLESRGLSPNTLGLASGIAFASSLAVLYLLGEGWNSMRLVQIFTIIAGLGVGLAGSYEVLTRRPVQLLVPAAQLLLAVLALTMVLRFVGERSASRAALAWSLGLHLCLLPLTTRLWAIFFGERANASDVARRRRLLGDANDGVRGTLLVRVLESDPGFTEAELIGGGKGVLRLPTSTLSPRPRPGLIYVLSQAVVINRTVPGSEERGEWARYVVSVDDTVMLGDRAEVTDPAESAELAWRSFSIAIGLSAALTALAAFAAL